MTSYHYKSYVHASESGGRASNKYEIKEWGVDSTYRLTPQKIDLPPLPKSEPPKPKPEHEPYSIDYHGLVFLWRWNEFYAEFERYEGGKPSWFTCVMRDQ